MNISTLSDVVNSQLLLHHNQLLVIQEPLPERAKIHVVVGNKVLLECSNSMELNEQTLASLIDSLAGFPDNALIEISCDDIQNIKDNAVGFNADGEFFEVFSFTELSDVSLSI